jgi:hypothetical protein
VTGMTISCRTKCRDEVSCAKWALARSDRAVFRQVTKIATATMGARHEPDVQAPDAVPNAAPHALPLLRNGPEGSTWGLWPERSTSIWKGMSIRQTDKRSDFEVRYAAMHDPTLLRNAGGASIGS